MSAGIYANVNGVTRKAKKLYANVNGVTREIKEMYANVNGVTRCIFQARPVVTSVSVSGTYPNWLTTHYSNNYVDISFPDELDPSTDIVIFKLKFDHSFTIEKIEFSARCFNIARVSGTNPIFEVLFRLNNVDKIKLDIYPDMLDSDGYCGVSKDLDYGVTVPQDIYYISFCIDVKNLARPVGGKTGEVNVQTRITTSEYGRFEIPIF